MIFKIIQLKVQQTLSNPFSLSYAAAAQAVKTTREQQNKNLKIVNYNYINLNKK